ncbi:MAG: cellulase family glycosylhydrolase, partial [Anaerolineae bacterium]|nr:cellulase family glycosylhydrolase [Anaerolineae bacterium]MDW8071815.1 cellulase family glycosylhydrolase [Anaerolineae bacterium]
MGRRSSWAAWLPLYALAVALAILLASEVGSCFHSFAFYLTGEEALLPQVTGVIQLAFNLIRPPLQLAEDVPVAHTGLNPFGVNTFLQNEADPLKRRRAIEMIAAAGFRWIRQEFPWEDIEIHGPGDTLDRRHTPPRSAWEKYDQIVDLCQAYGIQIIARLSTPPDWSRRAGKQKGAFAPPDNLEDFGNYVEAVVRRYRGRIRYYQIWNEPNIYPE